MKHIHTITLLLALAVTPVGAQTYVHLKFGSGREAHANTSSAMHISFADNKISITQSDKTAIYNDSECIITSSSSLPNYERAVRAEGYSTFTPVADVNAPSGVKAFVIKEIKDGEAVGEAVSTLEAGCGYLLEADEKGTTHNFVFTPILAPSRPVNRSNMLVGALADTPVEPKSVFTLGPSNEGEHKIGFWLYTGTRISAGTAYMKRKTETSVREFIPFVIDDTPTSVDDIHVPYPFCIDNASTITGQRADRNYRGILIINGKKYFAI